MPLKHSHPSTSSCLFTPNCNTSDHAPCIANWFENNRLLTFSGFSSALLKNQRNFCVDLLRLPLISQPFSPFFLVLLLAKFDDVVNSGPIVTFTRSSNIYSRESDFHQYDGRTSSHSYCKWPTSLKVNNRIWNRFASEPSRSLHSLDHL